MKHYLIIALLCFACNALAQTKQYVFHLWPDGAPNTNEVTEPEEYNGRFAINITDPVLTVFVPEHCNGLAIITCPGGSYCQVWQGTEGLNLADWYNQQGIVYAVLKYRLPNGGHKDVPLSDVHQAMKIMKDHQAEYGFTKLGIQGCSAGGHLASTAATHYTTAAERPDFQILFYPVISFDPEFTHFPTRESLIGKDAPQYLVDLYSNERQVTSDTPTAFIVASTNDGLVPVRNSVEYYNALLKHKVSATMCLFPTGDHGWFGNTEFSYCPVWRHALSVWLSELPR